MAPWLMALGSYLMQQQQAGRNQRAPGAATAGWAQQNMGAERSAPTSDPSSYGQSARGGSMPGLSQAALSKADGLAAESYDSIGHGRQSAAPAAASGGEGGNLDYLSPIMQNVTANSGDQGGQPQSGYEALWTRQQREQQSIDQHAGPDPGARFSQRVLRKVF